MTSPYTPGGGPEGEERAELIEQGMLVLRDAMRRGEISGLNNRDVTLLVDAGWVSPEVLRQKQAEAWAQGAHEVGLAFQETRFVAPNPYKEASDE